MNNIIATPYTCDRCNSDNAIRLTFTIDKNKADIKNKTQNDLCSSCIINMCSVLFNRIEYKDREKWVHAFLRGVIN